MATDNEYRQQQLKDARAHRDLLRERLEKLRKARAVETDEARKFQLDKQIEENEADLRNAEAEVHQLEAPINEAIARAHAREAKGSLEKALAAWEEVRQLDPGHPDVDSKIRILQERIAVAAEIEGLIQRLAIQVGDLKEVFGDLVNDLKYFARHDDEKKAGPYLALVKAYLAGDLTATDLAKNWHVLRASKETPAEQSPSTTSVAAIAGRLQRGELALFLGADLYQILQVDAPDIDDVAKDLARGTPLEDFNGSLSVVSEYYEMSHEYGKEALVQRLNGLLPETTNPLYAALAQLKTSLIIVSTSYEKWLEEEFRKANKKFAVVSAILPRTPEAAKGRYIVKYSDRAKSRIISLGEELSEEDLLKQGYSIIYKVRGIVDERAEQSSKWLDAVLLSEDSHFDFAATTNQLIPDYIGQVLSERGLLLLGCTARHWEERLLVRAILEKRGQARQQALTFRENPGQFENVFWSNKKVTCYPISVHDFVTSLEVQSD